MRKILSSLVLAMLCFAIAGKAQVMTVSGRVTDDKGVPIPSASVVVKGKKTTGAAADAQGNYRITAAKGDVLIISSVSFAPKEVTVGTSTTLNVSLNPDASLSEVVVTAMGIKRSEKALGYAVSTVSPNALLQKSEPNILNNLAGKVPGVDIRAGQGAPGAASRIQIRGVSSFNGGEPLIVVDGIPYSNNLVNTTNPFSGGGAYGSGIGNLDPNDIESINVLKGAAAASLYGSRAANGVLLITTKSGAPKKGAKSLNVTYRTGYSMEKISDIPVLQNTYGAGANFRTQSSNGSWGAKFGKGVIYDASGVVIGTSASGIDSIPATTWATMYANYPELFPNGKAAYKAYPNNVSDLFNTGSLWENSIGMNGGEGNSLFNVTLSRVDQMGYITNSSYTKNNFSVGGQTAIGNLTIGASIQYTKSKQVGGFTGAAQSFISQWGRTYTMARNWDIVSFPIETRAGAQIGFNDGQYTNPIWGAWHNVITSIDERAVANIRASYKFSNRIKLDVNGGVNSYSLSRDQVIDKSSYGSADNALGTLTEVVNRSQEIQAKAVLVYNNPKLSDNFSLDVNLGADVNERTGRAQQVYGVDFVIPGMFNLTNTRRQTFSGDSRSKRRLVGFFGDASLGYKGYAYLNMTGRMDLTSTLPYKNAQYFYPGISGALVWSDAFKLKSNWFDYGKIRAGYAMVGNDAAPHNGEPIFGLNAAGFLGQPTATRGGSSYDPELTPEFTRELELGTDMRFFKQRVGFELTWYNKRSTDLIYAIGLPQTTGYSSFFTNLGEIRNTGWEVALDLKPVITKDFEWNIRTIFTRNVNTVEKLVDGLTRDQLNVGWIEPGMPYGYLRGSFSARDADGNLLINTVSGMPMVDPNAGMVGDPNADYKMGITNTLSYKGFQLNILFDVTKGGDMYSETISGMLGRGVTKDTEDREKNRVITGVYSNATPVTGADGQLHYTPLLVGGKPVQNQTRVTTNDLFFTAGTGASFATNGAFEYAVYDATIYRLREIGLSYSLPTSILHKIKLTNVTISLTGRNLWWMAPNIPKYTNFDPDVNSVVGAGAQGYESGTAPSTKRFGVNLNITF
jgi:TonB-linked SusC/RagA family outer membrane protein